jgi:hypothetical protein
MNRRAPTIVLWILQSLLAAVFFMAGGSKLAGVMQAVDMYNQIGWGQWFRYATGSDCAALVVGFDCVVATSNAHSSLEWKGKARPRRMPPSGRALIGESGHRWK